MTPTPMQIDGSVLDVDAVMRTIREQLIKRRASAELAGLDFDALARGVYQAHGGGRFEDSLFERLFQAEMLRDKTQVALFVTPRPIPVIGGLVARLRVGLHQIALFYVNMSAQRQIGFNVEISAALNQLVKALEKEREETQTQKQALEHELTALRTRLDTLERAR